MNAYTLRQRNIAAEEDVRALVDRIAAALYLGDSERAREVAEDFRKDCVEAGRLFEQNDERERHQEKLNYEHTCNALFLTKDGLTSMQRIQGDGPRLPYSYKRPCRIERNGPIDCPPPGLYDPIPVRTYELIHEWESGLPVYKEV